jgi:Ca-activated chloride channel homolog
MHLRNKTYLLFLGSLLCVLVALVAAQAAPQQSQQGSSSGYDIPSPDPQPANNPAPQPAANAPSANAPAGTPPAANSPANQPQVPTGDNNGPAPQSPNQPTDTVRVRSDKQVESTAGGGYIIRTNVQEVLLHASVVDDRNRLVTNLDRSAFTVFEDGQPQQITRFDRRDVPVALGVIIDNSGSMREKRQAVNDATVNLVKASNPDDKVFVVNFNDEYWLDVDYTGQVDKLKEGLDKIESRGGTALYDAIIASAEHLKSAPLQKKVLLVVTDGEDNASRDTLEQAIRRVQYEDGPTIYTIGILGNDSHQRRAKRALQEMAEQTGGVAFFPRDLAEVDAITQAVGRDIRNQYVITYRSPRSTKAGVYHQVKVEARAPHFGKLTVRTKTGYYAGTERAAAQPQQPPAQ